MVILLEHAHAAVLTTGSCLMHGQWIVTDHANIVKSWIDLVRGHITDWDFQSIWDATFGKNMYETGGIMKVVHLCLGHTV